jgi:ABC-type amino acid transport substrate-binding protein
LIIKHFPALLPRLGSLLGILCCLVVIPAAAATITVPRPKTAYDQRDAYPWALLRMALEKSGARYEFRLAPVLMTQERVLLEIEKENGSVDIVATMTSKEREKRMLAVRIPIDKGLNGWRLPLVQASRKELFAHVKDLKGLSALRGVQGHDWPDTPIMRANALPVSTTSDYESMFSMLAAGRVDYFPRSLMEIFPEAAVHRTLAVDRHIALHYPTATYFFVNRNNTGLAAAVRRGLEAAIADGSFDTLFNHYFAQAIRLARMEERQVIELRNPMLPDGLPVEHQDMLIKFNDVRRTKPYQ